MPSSEASCSSRISGSVARASASTLSPWTASASSITWPAARSSEAIFLATTAACSPGRRSGAAGTIEAATSATAPPISASVQRVNAAPGVGSSPITKIDCTAAWLRKTCPEEMKMPTAMAIATTIVICQAPSPMTCTTMSPRKTPSATPMVTSVTRRSR